MNNKILIFGSSGLLGSSLNYYLNACGYNVISMQREKYYLGEFLSYDLLKESFLEIRPDVVINLSALTNVDGCENNLLKSYYVNSLLPGMISKAISTMSNRQPFFVHISTDQVYDGFGVHKEDDVRPTNVYGLTKLLGELMIRNCEYVILRTNFFGKSKSPSRLSFTDWIYNSLKEKKQITVFSDVTFNPIHLDTLCSFVQLAFESRISGIYNVGAINTITKSDFAFKFALSLGISNPDFIVGRIEDAALKAQRPLNMSMDVRCFEKTFSCICPDINDEIQKSVNEYSYE